MTVEIDRLEELLVGASPSCRLLAEFEEGPYHRDVHPERRDITEDRTGVALQLGLRFVGVGGTPGSNAMVDVWHADHDGRYSGFRPPATGVVAPDETFLRGCQRTDANGICAFTTIYPGWYPGRTVHVHLAARLEDGRSLITQLFFPDAISDEILAGDRYSRRGIRDTVNDTDTIFADRGADTMLTMQRSGPGWLGTLCAAIETADGR